MINPDICVSVIVSTLNSEKTLEQSLESIISQKGVDFEVIIIDGGSSDDTIKIIQKYSKDLAYWISEKDNGIYDAWNKAVKLAKGNWICFVGSDDLICEGGLKTYGDYIEKNSIAVETYDIISSKVQITDFNLNIKYIIGGPWKWPDFLKSMSIAHVGAWHSRSFFVKYGFFNSDYKIVGDYEILLRAKNRLVAGFIPEITAIMRHGGVSDSVEAIQEAYKAKVQTGGDNRFFTRIRYRITLLKYYLTKFFN